MGKVVEKERKKKKGRPSLLDLQKRNLKEQHHHQQQQQQKQKHHNHKNKKRFFYSAQNPSPNYQNATPTSLRRSTRRNPTSSSERSYSLCDDDNDDDLEGKRREKKLKLVLKLPPNNDKSPIDSNYCTFEDEDQNDAASNHKKRKINAIFADGSIDKGDKSDSGAKPTNNVQGPSTPLPDNLLLQFILDRLQKKDTYGVFSEPVDPKELPDYHEVIEHPMDFGTVRKKLTSGAYVSLEHFEKDVFLICSNAMQYNAPDTIYFRQARSIQELAIKNFENLRQDSDDNAEAPKIVRRGRPPTKFKKPLGRPSMDRTGSEFSSDANLAAGVETSLLNQDVRKGPLSDKSGFEDLSGPVHGPHNDVYTGWLGESKNERNDEAAGSLYKANSLRNGKKQSVPDENRRNTYRQSLQSSRGREPSVLATFDGERKQLMAVGLFSELGYARSLARFAAILGPISWNIAAKRIEKCLPDGVKYGPGWVGEFDIPPQKPLLSSAAQGQLSLLQHLSVPENSSSAAITHTVELEGDKLLEKLELDDSSEKHAHPIHSMSEGNLSHPLLPSASPSPSHFVANTSAENCMEKTGAMEGLNPPSSFAGVIRPRAPFQIHPGMNGINDTYGFHLPAQMGKVIGSARPAGCNFQSPQVLDTVSRTNTNSVHPMTQDNLMSEDPKVPEHSGTRNSSPSLPNSGSQTLGTPRSGHNLQSSWKGLSPQQKQDSGSSSQQKPDLVPPDLNVQFQTPGSPGSSRVDSAQPDLVLQL
ncbi:Bromodomain domain-containing protein [Cephalotus follicularis]|uniref:Bromodomain domain-containing protein n=1 Tax=Cephalotus follicularis TaxID=3775 RepID=A0A1Q3D8G7_CEPFO|nr:Bromodomain domain-containing protein [Cephalotus follicularis]